MNGRPVWTRRVRVFAGDQAAGNLASVSLFGSLSAAQSAPASAASVHCHLAPAAQAASFDVLWFGPGGKIRRCGHGAMAAACALGDALPSRRGWWTLRLADESWRIQRRLGFARALMPRCELSPADTYHPETTLGLEVSATANTAAEQGYRVVELARAQDLATVDPARIAGAPLDGRAWIVGVAVEGKLTLRYFAPQYGVPEDAGTGSIASAVHAFWAPRLKKNTLAVAQHSAGGARWAAIGRGEAIALIGRVETIGD